MQPCFDLALDVGCGSGQSTFVLSEVARRVVGSDVSPAQVKEATKEAEKRRESNVEFKYANCLLITSSIN